MFRTKHVKPKRKETEEENVSSSSLEIGEKSIFSYKKVEIPNSPYRAMEFLSRSWSPSASDFLQIFPLNNGLLLPQIKYEHDEDDYDRAPMFMTKQDDIKIQMMDLDASNSSCKSLTGLIRLRRNKKKEEARLRTTQVHAALSLTQLAAAISGISSGLHKRADCSQEINGDFDTFNVLSSAASLLTTVCAEAAESLGAQRSRVRAAISSGAAIQSPMDMIAVTATAATCLRGASLLKSRVMLDSSEGIQDMLRVGAEICIILPSGRRECARVSIYLKNNHLMFSFRKKYFGGVLRHEKEYKVTDIITQESTEHEQEKRSLCLKTNNGIIKLIFEDDTQPKIWISTIFNLLEMRSKSKQGRYSSFNFRFPRSVMY